MNDLYRIRTHTNENLEQLKRGMNLTGIESILGITGSGEQGLTLSINSKSVDSIDIIQQQSYFAYLAIKYLKENNSFLQYQSKDDIVNYSGGELNPLFLLTNSLECNDSFLEKNKKDIIESLDKISIYKEPTFFRDFSTDKQYDRIYLSNIIDHIDNPNALKELFFKSYNLLKKGGLIYIATEISINARDSDYFTFLKKESESLSKAYKNKYEINDIILLEKK